ACTINDQLADHLMQRLDFTVEGSEDIFRFRRDYSPDNIEVFLGLLNDQDWSLVYRCREFDVNNQFNNFMKVFVPIFNASFKKNFVELIIKMLSMTLWLPRNVDL
ncbi:hypothetical protein HHI36_007658, partial [Cryptolaemus montrouzieri]